MRLHHTTPLTVTCVALLFAVTTQAWNFNTVAGGNCGYQNQTTPGNGLTASFQLGLCVTYDITDTFYWVADTNNNVIRQVYFNAAPEFTAPTVTFWAGTGTAGPMGGPGLTTSYNLPYGIIQDLSGYLYVANLGTCTIYRQNTQTKACTLWAGSGVCGPSTDGLGQRAVFLSPIALTVDLNLIVYVVDNLANNIRKIYTNQLVQTIAGSGNAGNANSNNGLYATFNSPQGITATFTGILYVADTNNNAIRKIDTNGAVTTISTSTSTNNYQKPCSIATFGPTQVMFLACGDGSAWELDITAANGGAIAEYTAPRSGTNAYCITTRQDLTAVVATYGCQVGEYNGGSPAPPPTPICGQPTTCGFLNCGGQITLGTQAQVGTTLECTWSSDATYFLVSDFDNNQVRSVVKTGTTYNVQTFAGSLLKLPGVTCLSSGLLTMFDGPMGIDVDGNGIVYVANQLSGIIYKMSYPSGSCSYLTSSQKGYAEGNVPNAQFGQPTGLVLDSKSSYLYVTDILYQNIRKISLTGGPSSTVTGNLGKTTIQAGWIDGPIATALFHTPTGITIASDDSTLFVADTFNNVIRQINQGATTGNIVFTLAGQGPTTSGGTTISHPGRLDGQATTALFNGPYGITYNNGFVYVTDNGNPFVGVSGYDLRAVDITSGTVYTLLEDPNRPTGVCLNPAGTVLAIGLGCSLDTWLLPTTPSTPISGNPNSCGLVNGPPSATPLFNMPWNLACVGNSVYVADSANNQIREVFYDGSAVTVVGQSTAGNVCDGAMKANLEFNNPRGIVFNKAGDMWVASFGTCVIQKIAVTSFVCTTLAGSSCGCSVGAGAGTGVSARFSGPIALALDATEKYMFVADYTANQIRMIVVATGVTSLWGGSSKCTSGYHDGNSTSALFCNPGGVAVINTPAVIYVAGTGTHNTVPNIPYIVYVADTCNNVIRMIYDSNVFTVAGQQGMAGGGTGTGAGATFNGPLSMAVVNNFQLFITDMTGDKIRLLDTTTGLVTNIVSLDNPPRGICYNTSGKTIDFTVGCAISSKSTPIVTNTPAPTQPTPTLLGGNETCFCNDGFNLPGAVIYLPNGNIVVVDTGNNKLRQVTGTGVISNLTGTGIAGATCTSDPTKTQFDQPRGVVVDFLGNIYVTNAGSCTVYKLKADTLACTILAGSPYNCAVSTDGKGRNATFQHPTGLTIDTAGTTLWIADDVAHVIRTCTTDTGTVTIFAGTYTKGYVDGLAITQAQLHQPTATAYLGNANQTYVTTAQASAIFHPIFLLQVIYIADFGNNVIRQVYLFNGENVVSTLCGNGAAAEIDGRGYAASFNGPISLVIYRTTLFVVDNTGQAIRVVDTQTGTVITFITLSSYPNGVVINPFQLSAVILVGNSVQAADATVAMNTLSNTVSHPQTPAPFIGINTPAPGIFGTLFAAGTISPQIAAQLNPVAFAAATTSTGVSHLSVGYTFLVMTLVAILAATF